MSAAETRTADIARPLRRIEIDVELSELRPGSSGVIVGVEAGTPEGRRLGDLGFVRGTHVRVLTRAPLGDPTVFDLRGYRLCLRRSEARRVRVKPV